MINLKNKKGMVLLASLSVAVVLFILSGAYVTSSLSQSKVLQAELNSEKAFYLAEKGVEYAYVEATSHNYDWKTYQAVPDAQTPPGYNLVAVDAIDRPTITLGSKAQYEADGTYKIISSSIAETQVKTYADPVNVNDTWVLSKTIVNGQDKIIRFKIATKSLYRFFIFSPEGGYIGAADGNGTGGIHRNKDADAWWGDNGSISLSSGTYLKRIGELSCPGSFYYYRGNDYHWPNSEDWDGSDNGKGEGTASDGKAIMKLWDGILHLPYEVMSSKVLFGVDDSYGNPVPESSNAKIWIDDGSPIPNDGIEQPGEIRYVPRFLLEAYWAWKKYGKESDTDQVDVEIQIDRDIDNTPIHKPTANSGVVDLTNPLDYLIDREMRLLGAGINEFPAAGNEYTTGSYPTLLDKTKNINIVGIDYSEYDIYRYVIQKDTPAPPEVTNYIDTNMELVGGFWDWWKIRHTTTFSGDTAGIPGWKRIFWEAWFDVTPNPPNVAPVQLNQEWWVDLKYGTDFNKGKATESVDYLNSMLQPTPWKNWLASAGLINIVKDGNNGGIQEIPPAIETNYSQRAQENGLYVSEGGVISLNGVPQALLSWIDNKSFFNVMSYYLNPDDLDDEGRPKPAPINVLDIDIGSLLSNYPGQVPNNGIIYVANKNVRLVNAAELPTGGLTVVSPYNIYIKGNYNTIDWQPAAVITNSYVYFLSSDFNDPQVYPSLIYWWECPYELQFEEFRKTYLWGDSGERWPQWAQDSDCGYCTADMFSPTPFPKPSSWDELNAGAVDPVDENDDGLWPWADANLTAAQKNCLLGVGRKHYTQDNQANMRNVVQNPPSQYNYNVAIVSPVSGYPAGLESWNAYLKNKGAFITLESAWSATQDLGGGVVYDPTVKHSPWGYHPSYSSGVSWYGMDSYEYEAQFADPQKRPPGDLLSSSVVFWQEVSNFDKHT